MYGGLRICCSLTRDPHCSSHSTCYCSTCCSSHGTCYCSTCCSSHGTYYCSTCCSSHGTCYCSTCCRQANWICQQQPCFLFCSSLSQILGLKPLRGSWFPAVPMANTATLHQLRSLPVPSPSFLAIFLAQPDSYRSW